MPHLLHKRKNVYFKLKIVTLSTFVNVVLLLSFISLLFSLLLKESKNTMEDAMTLPDNSKEIIAKCLLILSEKLTQFVGLVALLIA